MTESPQALCVLGMKDRRLQPILEAMSAIERGEEGSVEGLRGHLQQVVACGIHIEDLYALSPEYEVETRPSSEWGRFDALFRRKGESCAASWPSPVRIEGDSHPACANVPYQETHPDALGDELRNHIREYLPEYMVPTSVVVMDAFPLTANGKIDRNALPAPQSTGSTKVEYSVPAGELEETIAGIWKGLLNLERVGRQDNIFDIGAHSLLVVEANAQLSEKLGKRLPLVNMFRFSTIASLAEHLGGDARPSQSTRSRAQDREGRAKAAADRRRAARLKRVKGGGG